MRITLLPTYNAVIIGFVLASLCACKDIQPLVFPAAVPLSPAFAEYEAYKQSHPADSAPLQTPPAYAMFFFDTILCGLIKHALENNFDLQSALTHIQASRSEYLRASGARLPFAAPTLAIGATRYGNFTEEGVGNYDTRFSPNITEKQKVPFPVLPDLSVGLATQWEVDIWNKLNETKRAQAERVWASELGMKFLQTNIVAEIASRYYELICLDYTLGVLEQNITFQERALTIVQVQKASGYATSLGLKQLEAQLLTSRTTYKEVEQNIIIVENALNSLMGRGHQPIRRNVGTFQEGKLSTWKNISMPTLLNRPDIRQAEHLLSAAKLDVSVARKNFFPSLNLSGFLGLNSFSIQEWFNVASLASHVFASLAAPVINRSKIKADYIGSKARALSAFQHYQKIVVNAYNEVKKIFALQQKIAENYTLQRRRVQLLDEAKKYATDLYIANNASYWEILTAQQNYLTAFLDMVDTQKRSFLLNIALYKALGGGWQ